MLGHDPFLVQPSIIWDELRDMDTWCRSEKESFVLFSVGERMEFFNFSGPGFFLVLFSAQRALRLTICLFTWFSESQIPLFLWACPTITSFQVQLVLEGWLISSWYSLRLHANKCFIFNQNIEVSVLFFCDYFWYGWESFIFQLEN